MAVQQHSARVHRFVTVLWVLCFLLVLAERFSAVTIHALQTGTMRPLAIQAVAAIPEFLFLIALWWIRDALGAFARGELFGAAMTRMLDRVGVMLTCAAAVRILIVPGLSRVLGETIGYWIAFDAEAMILAAIGLALRAIASVLRHAAAMQSELDEIF